MSNEAAYALAASALAVALAALKIVPALLARGGNGHNGNGKEAALAEARHDEVLRKLEDMHHSQRNTERAVVGIVKLLEAKGW